MARARSWEVSDAFWQRVEPLIPARAVRQEGRLYQRKP
ncbi:MAG: IS5/IS1182 family transposase, partial [Acidobacteriota bacterium]|nr:IS5/IS1182 family transposase [Acidobacteriota bacterium]